MYVAKTSRKNEDLKLEEFNNTNMNNRKIYTRSVTKNLIFLYNQRNNQYYPIILYYNNILKKNILLVNHY